MTSPFPDPETVMRRALHLASHGLGAVEPNPPVGAVVVDEQLRLLGEGYHERFGGPHAEVNALRRAGGQAAGGMLFVTLEPCSHHGQTGPCTRTVIESGLRKVLVAVPDPAAHASGRGIAELRSAGLEVEVGRLEEEARKLLAPYMTLVTQGRPWVHAKWAMSLDGKIASRTGASRWISNSASRRIVHQLRGRMDAMLVGLRTVLVDDPLLTARPPGPRTAARVVLDPRAELPLDSQLIRTLDRAPVVVAAAETAPENNVRRLQRAGVEALRLPAVEDRPDLRSLLQELGRRRMTHILVEGGGRLLGSFFDGTLIDEIHAFVAPKLVGGDRAPVPLAGLGLEAVAQQPQLQDVDIECLDGDLYVHGRLGCGPPAPSAPRAGAR